MRTTERRRSQDAGDRAARMTTAIELLRRDKPIRAFGPNHLGNIREHAPATLSAIGAWRASIAPAMTISGISRFKPEWSASRKPAIRSRWH